LSLKKRINSWKKRKYEDFIIEGNDNIDIEI